MIDDQLESGRRLALERLQQSGESGGDSAFDRIVRLAALALDAPSAGFAVITLERHQFRARHRLPQPESVRLVTLCASGMLNDEPLIVPDLTQDARFANDPLVAGPTGLRFLASAPVRSPELLSLGALCVLDVRPRRIMSHQLESLKDLALVLEREILLRSLMRIDPLTGLQTRFYYEFELDREWRRARRSRTPVSAMLIDVDGMASYNEIFGNAEGDTALGEIGHMLARRFRRASDVLVRVGGDRMLALLPETEAADVLQLARNVCMEVERMLLGNPQAGRTLTVSVGCATAANDADLALGYEVLIERAETALAQAKREGGNRAQQHSGTADLAVEARLSF